MKIKQLAIVIVGVIVTLLGLLWFLQGVGILQLCPVLCFTDCKCITGGSLFWEIVGAIAFVIGIIFIALSLKGWAHRTSRKTI